MGLIEIVIYIFAEIVGQGLLELFARSLIEPFKQNQKRNPVFAAIGYASFGAILGLISLVLFPGHFTGRPDVRAINLIITPLCVGLLMVLLGNVRAKHGEQRLRLDQFGYGYLFALSIGLIRFSFAR